MLSLEGNPRADNFFSGIAHLLGNEGIALDIRSKRQRAVEHWRPTRVTAPLLEPVNQLPTNIVEFTVSELSFALRRTVEENFEQVRVRGEISGFKGASGSGHCYFTLKDAGACLDAVVWRLTFQRLRFKPQEGLEMVATGKLTTYPSRSRYQLVVENLEPAGEGALMALLEERRGKLASRGPLRSRPQEAGSPICRASSASSPRRAAR